MSFQRETNERFRRIERILDTLKTNERGGVTGGAVPAPVAQYDHLEADAVPSWQRVVNLTVPDNAYIGLPGPGGRLAFDLTPDPDQLKVTDADLNFVTAAHGIIHVDGVSAGPPRQLLLADGTRYVPGALAANDLPVHTHSGALDGGSLVIGTTDTDATPGSVLFAGAGGVIEEDNANFFYDDAQDYLGLGNAAPAGRLHVSAATTTDIAAILQTTDDNLTKRLLEVRDSADAVLLSVAAGDSATFFQINQADTTSVLTVDTVNRRLGVGTAAPNTALQITGSATVNAQVVSIDSEKAIYVSSPQNVAGIKAVLNAKDAGGVQRLLIGLTTGGSDTAMNIPSAAGSRFVFFKGASTQVAQVDSNGKLSLSTTDVTAQLNVKTISSTTVGQIIRGAAAQTANLQEWQNSAGTVMSFVYADGGFDIDQSNAAANIPALKLNQVDVSEQCIQFSSDGADRDIYLWTVEVTGAPAFMWDESETAYNIIGADLNFATGLGITHADGVAAGMVLIADGTRYVPSTLPGGFTGFAAPALTFTTANAAGAATTAIRTDASLAIFDATNPTSIDAGDAAAVGAAAFAARRDHQHAVTSTADGETNPGELLQGDANGRLRLSNIGLGIAPTVNAGVRSDVGSLASIWGSTVSAVGVAGVASGGGIGGDFSSITGTGLNVSLTGAGAAIATFQDLGTPVFVVQDGGQSDFAEYIRHLGDNDTFWRFQTDQATLDCGGVTMIDAVEAATDYLWLHAGLVGINETANANMTIGLTIDQAANDDEALNIRSSDVGAVLSTVETGTFMNITKSAGAAGGARLNAFKDSGAINAGALQLSAYLEEDVNVDKTTAARALVEIFAFQTDGTDIENTVADGNLVMIRTQRGGSQVTTHWFDEDGDFGYNGALVPYDDLDDAAMARDLQLVLTGRQGVEYNQAAMVEAGILHPSEHGMMVSHKKMTALQLGAIRQGYEDRLALEQRVEHLEKELLKWQSQGQ